MAWQKNKKSRHGNRERKREGGGKRGYRERGTRGNVENEQGEAGGETSCTVPRVWGEARSLYSRQEPEHSIVCFRKIRDRTAKATGAQFTLLNRRNGLEAPDECCLFDVIPRLSSPFDSAFAHPALARPRDRHRSLILQPLRSPTWVPRPITYR